MEASAYLWQAVRLGTGRGVSMRIAAEDRCGPIAHDAMALLQALERASAPGIGMLCTIDARTECFLRGMRFQGYAIVSGRAVVSIGTVRLLCPAYSRSAAARQPLRLKDWDYHAYSYCPDERVDEAFARSIAVAPDGRKFVCSGFVSRDLAELHGLVQAMALNRINLTIGG